MNDDEIEKLINGDESAEADARLAHYQSVIKELFSALRDERAQMQKEREGFLELSRKWSERVPQINVAPAQPSVVVQPAGQPPPVSAAPPPPSAWNIRVMKRDKEGRIDHVQFTPWTGPLGPTPQPKP